MAPNSAMSALVFAHRRKPGYEKINNSLSFFYFFFLDWSQLGWIFLQVLSSQGSFPLGGRGPAGRRLPSFDLYCKEEQLIWPENTPGKKRVAFLRMLQNHRRKRKPESVSLWRADHHPRRRRRRRDCWDKGKSWGQFLHPFNGGIGGGGGRGGFPSLFPSFSPPARHPPISLPFYVGYFPQRRGGGPSPSLYRY